MRVVPAAAPAKPSPAKQPGGFPGRTPVPRALRGRVPPLGKMEPMQSLVRGRRTRTRGSDRAPRVAPLVRTSRSSCPTSLTIRLFPTGATQPSEAPRQTPKSPAWCPPGPLGEPLCGPAGGWPPLPADLAPLLQAVLELWRPRGLSGPSAPFLSGLVVWVPGLAWQDLAHRAPRCQCMWPGAGLSCGLPLLSAPLYGPSLVFVGSWGLGRHPGCPRRSAALARDHRERQPSGVCVSF